MPTHAEVVIVGGGIIGMSVALHLARAGCTDVLVLERAQVGSGSSGRGVGGFRQQFDTAINVRLSQLGLATLTELGEQIELQQRGYLYLALSAGSRERQRARAAQQQEWGVPVELLEPAEVATRWPFLHSADVLGAAFCPLDGYARPPLALAAFRRAAEALGVRVVEGAEVRAIELEPQRRRVQALDTTIGRVAAGQVVIAAGAWSARVAALAGVELPVQPLKRQVFQTSAWPAGRPPWETPPPLTIDEDSGFHFRPDGAGVLLAMSSDEQLGVEEFSLDMTFGARVLAQAQQRLPALAGAALAGGRAGLYEMTPDAHPVLGALPGVQGLLCACGFSGHGFMHAPAAGLLLAELIVQGHTSSLDIAPLSITRFAEGRLLGAAHTL